MSFDVGEFSAQIGSLEGLLLSSRFRVRAHTPTGDSRFLEFFCETFNLPGVSIVTAPIRTLGYGVPTDAPLVPAYGEASMQCFTDSDGQVVEFFTRWQQSVVNYDYAPGRATTSRNSGAYPFQVSYASDYVGQVEFTSFDVAGFPTRIVTMHDAWPKSVGQTTFSWGAKDTLAMLPVQLAYRSWTSDDMKPRDAQNTSS